MTIFDDNFWWHFLMTLFVDNFQIFGKFLDFRIFFFRFFENFVTWHLTLETLITLTIDNWQLRTTILTITLWPLNKEWRGQHSQFLRCFVSVRISRQCQNDYEDIYLCRGGLSVREMVEGPITRENKEAMVESGWGHMEEHTVNASGKLVRLVAAQAKSLTWWFGFDVQVNNTIYDNSKHLNGRTELCV